MSIFMIEKLPHDEFQEWFDKKTKEVAEARKKEKSKKKKTNKNVIGKSKYDYNDRVKSFIDKRLAEIDTIRANEVEFNLDSYSDKNTRRRMEKGNSIAYKKIGVLEREIKEKDKDFFTFIKKAD